MNCPYMTCSNTHPNLGGRFAAIVFYSATIIAMYQVMKTPLILDNSNVNFSVPHLLITQPSWNKSYMGSSPDSSSESPATRDYIFKGGHVFERLQYCTVIVQLVMF